MGFFLSGYNCFAKCFFFAKIFDGKVRISRQLQVFVFKKGRKSRNIVPLRLTGGKAVMADPGWTLLMTLTAALLGKY